MAEDQSQMMLPEGEEGEVKDRGFFDFIKKDEEEKKEQCDEKPGEAGLEEGLKKMSIEEQKIEQEEKKEEGEEKKEEKHGLLDKLHRSSSSSSSSSSDEEEEVDENGEKKKKGLKDKIKEKVHEDKKEEDEAEKKPTEGGDVVSAGDNSVKVERLYENLKPVEPAAGDKKLVEKIKERLPGEHLKSEEEENASTAAPPPPVEECITAQQANEEHKEVPKEGFLEKIKEKLPAQHDKKEEVGESDEKTPPPPTEQCITAEQSNKEHEGEHKKGFLEKIKEKLSGHKTEEESLAATTPTQ